MHRWKKEQGRSHKVQFRCPAFRVSVTTPACRLVLPSQRDNLGGLAPASLCLRNHQPNPGVPVHFHTPQELHHQHMQREKAILHPEEQSLPKPPAMALRIYPLF